MGGGYISGVHGTPLQGGTDFEKKRGKPLFTVSNFVHRVRTCKSCQILYIVGKFCTACISRQIVYIVSDFVRCVRSYIVSCRSCQILYTVSNYVHRIRSCTSRQILHILSNRVYRVILSTVWNFVHHVKLTSSCQILYIVSNFVHRFKSCTSCQIKYIVSDIAHRVKAEQHHGHLAPTELSPLHLRVCPPSTGHGDTWRVWRWRSVRCFSLTVASTIGDLQPQFFFYFLLLVRVHGCSCKALCSSVVKMLPLKLHILGSLRCDAVAL